MNLRPTLLDGIIGQTKVKNILNISLTACKKLNEQFPHSLFYGPPGTGKTTFAQAIANETKSKIEIGNGANIRSVKALLPYLMRINKGSILFIDEIHRLPINVSEFLYVAVEENRIDLGKDEKITIRIPEFTFIGATTNVGSIPKPLFDRFTLKLALELYSDDEMFQIVTKNANKMQMNITDEAKRIIATSSRNTPRIANHRLNWIRHYSVSKNISIIKESDVLTVLDLEGVNKNGINLNDKKYLEALKRLQPAGINTISSAIDIPKDTIENVIEPFLLSLRLIKRTSKGRILCESHQ